MDLFEIFHFCFHYNKVYKVPFLWLRDNKENPANGITIPYSFQRVARDRLCAMSHREGITLPAFDHPVGSTGCQSQTARDRSPQIVFDAPQPLVDPAPNKYCAHKHNVLGPGADPGGSFWGTPKLHKEGKNVACVLTNTPRFT